MTLRTSATDPIRVAWVVSDVAPAGGRIGVTLAPGKRAPSVDGLGWHRDLDVDLARLRAAYQCDVLVSLLEDQELVRLGIADLLDVAAEHGIAVLRFPIADGGVPPLKPARELADCVVDLARRSQRVVIHCRGGLGRAGTVAACCLVRLGYDGDEAMLRTRAARPGAIETGTQEALVLRMAHWRGSEPGAFAVGPIPPDRWPYGPPWRHQRCCELHSGGVTCDCAASAADDEEWGA